jgi:hypothetical protein
LPGGLESGRTSGVSLEWLKDSLADHGAQYAAAGATFGAKAGATAGLARLLVILFATHFLLDTAALNQLTEPTDGLLNRLTVPNVQLNHKSSFRSIVTICFKLKATLYFRLFRIA